MGFFGWIGIMILIFYFMIIRPQNRREKERRALIDAVKSGDRILFAGGLLGTVTQVEEKTLRVEIAEKVRIEISKGAVSQVLKEGEAPTDQPA